MIVLMYLMYHSHSVIKSSLSKNSIFDDKVKLVKMTKSISKDSAVVA